MELQCLYVFDDTFCMSRNITSLKGEDFVPSCEHCLAGEFLGCGRHYCITRIRQQVWPIVVSGVLERLPLHSRVGHRIIMIGLGIFLATLYSALLSMVAADYGNMSLKLDRLLQGYDRRLRPGFGESPLVIKTDILVRSMGPVNERSMDYSMDCYFRQLWIDKRLALNVSMPNISLNIKFLERLWYPDTIFLNGGRSYVHMVPMPNKLFRINRDGTVLYSQRLTITAHCRMHLEKYPLDSQSCPLYVGSFAYSADDVLYEWRFGLDKSVEISKGMTLSQFDLLRTPCYNKTELFRGAKHSILSVHFYLRRHMGFFLINVYVPCCLLVVLSWVSFWINREATSDRIALGTMTVLTMTFIGLDNRNDLPRVSYSTALDIYVAFCFVFVLATIIQFAAVHYFTKFGCGEGPTLVQYIADEVELEDMLTNRGESNEEKSDEVKTSENGHKTTKPPSNVKSKRLKESALYKCWNCFFGTRNRHNCVYGNVLGLNSVSKIDEICRIVFPVIFSIFNIFYWSIYLADGVVL